MGTHVRTHPFPGHDGGARTSQKASLLHYRLNGDIAGWIQRCRVSRAVVRQWSRCDPCQRVQAEQKRLYGKRHPSSSPVTPWESVVIAARTKGSGVASGVRSAREMACAWAGLPMHPHGARQAIGVAWLHAAAGVETGCLSGPSWFFLKHAADFLCIVVSSQCLNLSICLNGLDH
jgi:hypothetical protein